MTLANFLTTNKPQLKLIRQLIVRDLDKISEFETIAYVDEANESYDVKIVINGKKQIVSTFCDCDAGGVCKHIVALVSHVCENRATEKTLKKTKSRKQSEINILLDSLDNSTLRKWISDTLQINKDLAYIFKNQFEIKEVVYNSDYIKRTVQESLQSVIGKRRKIETNEVKKFVEALTLSTKDLIDFLNRTPINLEKYALATVLIDELENINYKFYISSVKITRFIESLLDSLIKHLFNIKDIGVWQECALFYFSLIFTENIKLFELKQCEKIYEFSKTSAVKKEHIVSIIQEKINLTLKKKQIDFLNFGIDMECFILKVYLENNIFRENASKFKPHLFQNEYNMKLLDALMNVEQFAFAEKYCKEIIQGNNHERYNIPYLKYLIAIYKTNKEDLKLARLYSVYGKFIYDIDVYLFIKENLSETEFKRYRLSVMSLSRNSYQNGDLEAFNFYFEIKKLDGKDDDLFEMLVNSRNVYFANQYKEIALKLNERKFLEILFRFNYNYFDKMEEIKSITKFILAHVDSEKLQTLLKSHSSNSYSVFYKSIEKLLL